jgi:hypothetical protein
MLLFLDWMSCTSFLAMLVLIVRASSDIRSGRPGGMVFLHYGAHYVIKDAPSSQQFQASVRTVRFGTPPAPALYVAFRCYVPLVTGQLIHVLRCTQEACRAAGVKAYAVFVEFAKVFNSPPRAAIWECLEWLGCPPDLLAVIMAIH